MQLNKSTQVSTLNLALGISLTAFSLFLVGYTASRVYLSQSTNQNARELITPHEATIWSAVGR